MPRKELNELSGKGVISDEFRDRLLDPSTRNEALTDFAIRTPLLPEEIQAILKFGSDWAEFNTQLEAYMNDHYPVIKTPQINRPSKRFDHRF